MRWRKRGNDALAARTNPFTGWFCPASASHVPQGVPSETRGSTCPNLCLIVAFSNPLRRPETSAVRQDAGRLGADQFRTTKLGGPMDQAGRVPQRDALRTVGHDRVEAGIYLFGGICKKPHVEKAQRLREQARGKAGEAPSAPPVTKLTTGCRPSRWS